MPAFPPRGPQRTARAFRAAEVGGVCPSSGKPNVHPAVSEHGLVFSWVAFPGLPAHRGAQRLPSPPGPGVGVEHRRLLGAAAEASVFPLGAAWPAGRASRADPLEVTHHPGGAGEDADGAESQEGPRGAGARGQHQRPELRGGCRPPARARARSPPLPGRAKRRCLRAQGRPPQDAAVARAQPARALWAQPPREDLAETPGRTGPGLSRGPPQQPPSPGAWGVQRPCPLGFDEPPSGLFGRC